MYLLQVCYLPRSNIDVVRIILVAGRITEKVASKLNSQYSFVLSCGVSDIPCIDYNNIKILTGILRNSQMLHRKKLRYEIILALTFCQSVGNCAFCRNRR